MGEKHLLRKAVGYYLTKQIGGHDVRATTTVWRSSQRQHPPGQRRGSVPDDQFYLGQRLRRIPDGETGVRLNWIGWQREAFARHPAFELTPPDPKAYAPFPHFKLRPGGSSGKVVFAPLGYAEAALASYAVFSRLKQDSVIPSCRFQVSLPTPLAPVRAFLVEEEQASAQPAYETAMFAELDTITSGISHEELAIQWDVAIEFALLEGVAQALYEQTKTRVIEQLVRLGKQVPVDVELGYHLCYGDAGHKHFVEPKDTAKLVEVAHGISAGLTRSLNWISLPVPRERSDEAYFAPLLNLHLHPETELYLGLVHFTDGIEGTQKRIEAAQRVVAQFGVATECGCGRRPSETIPELLRLHREVAAPR